MKITGLEIIDEGRATRVTWTDGHSPDFTLFGSAIMRLIRRPAVPAMASA